MRNFYHLSKEFRDSSVLLTFLIIISFSFVGCATTPVTDKNSQLTQGNVQMNLVVGQTNKAQVLENFGAPNITTRDGSGKEVWSYQRAAQASQSKSGHWTIILVGQKSSGFESSSSMITLIIKFDENDIVSDFRSRTSNF
jgi:outer membrane protein assembly factor BamE (lipoprotein component of BamABCDE complex)